MKNGQRADHAYLAAHRHRINVRLALGRGEEIRPAISLENFLVELRRLAHAVGEIRRHHDGMALDVIDGDTGQALAVPETLDDALEIGVLALGQKRLHGFLQALGQHLRAFFEFAAARVVVSLGLVNCETYGYECDGDHQGDD